MRKLILLLLILPMFSHAQNRYVSNAGSNSNDGLTTSTPYLTMNKVRQVADAGGVSAGDTIFFRKGDTFYSPDTYQGMMWWGSSAGGSSPSGTAGNPIVFTSYGTGAMPNMLFVRPNTQDSTDTYVMSFNGVSYIVIDGLQFSDTRRANTKLGAAWTCAAVRFGGLSSGESTNNCTIKNCYMNNIGQGIVIVGRADSVYNCTMENFGNVDALGSDSYGANGVTITGNKHYIGNNTISGAWAYSDAFGLNGGAIEAFNTVDSCTIMYNTFYDCGAVCEFGATASASTCKFNLFAYNKFVNNGNISYVNVIGTFTITPTNNRFYNNVIIENKESRFSGVNFGDGLDTLPTWPTLPGAETKLFQNNGSPAANPVWNLQNNLIYNTNNMSVYSNGAIINHLSNVYFLKSGSSIGYTAGGSENNMGGVGQIFLDTTATNPINWDVHMPTALATGQTLGLSPDFGGNVVTGAGTPGIWQRIGSGTTTSNKIVLPASINGKVYGKIQ